MTEMNPAARDVAHMARAIRLAERGLYSCDPNPRVGCVIVSGGQVVGEGWHAVAGEAHAEINALKQAGAAARGATVYLSLEPCCHHGKTPPCTDALIRAGVKRVVAAMQDPNPKVAGKGFDKLRAAGIDVQAGVLEAQARALNPGFIQRMQHGRPWVRCKFGMSLDGRTALADGRSQWITGAAAREDVQRWRARSSAIMTGIGTVLADDPSLTVRIDTGAEKVRQPLRVVLDSHLTLSAAAKIISQPGRTLVFSTEQDTDHARALTRAGAEVFHLPSLSPALVLEGLARLEVNELWIEAGATLAGSFLRAGMIDELVLYVAPKILGDSARGLFRLPALESLDEAVKLEFTDVRAVGEDWRIVATVRK
jgi:diaminohydroxyphosphoribosylaminopyrimidine deaminase/5-amino-6-(5-phosphoribosylamino)uracil reductase